MASSRAAARCGGTGRGRAGSSADRARRLRRARPRRRAPCAARGRRGSAARWTGRPCARRRPSGTTSTHGAKLRIERTPAATSWSQTCWAEAAGVAMTPMARPCVGDQLGEVAHRLHGDAGDLLAAAGAGPGRTARPPGNPAWRTRCRRRARGRGCPCRRWRRASPGSGRARGRSGRRGGRPRSRRRARRRSRGGDRSLRSLALRTPAAAASSSEDTVVVPRSARPVRARRYSGSRATVASGIPRRALGSADTVFSGSFSSLAVRAWLGRTGASADYAFVNGCTKSQAAVSRRA